MRGTVITFDRNTNSGIISGQDGNRYTFFTQDWRASSFPGEGLQVDFVNENFYAKEIFVVQNSPVYAQSGTVLNKSRTAYILLGIFLGVFGIHNFYAGYQGKGIAQLLITVLSFGILGFIPWIWSIIEVITVDRDFYGNPML